MNVALFGGTFDPIHRGHLAIARAARDRFKLQRIYFVPADVPPHKQAAAVTPFEHRYAMVALATAAEPAFLPSLLEAPPRHGKVLEFRDSGQSARQPNYSIHTLRRLKSQLPSSARVFLLLGIDAFRGIANWRQPEELLEEAEFIVAARPRYSLVDLATALPATRRPTAAAMQPFKREKLGDTLVLPGVTLHLLTETHADVSATAIRDAAQRKRPLTRWLMPAVAEYIRKQHLYEDVARPQLAHSNSQQRRRAPKK
jgi:nicotinate-nucleotide adenylyltransferase